uniref:U77-Liphistoxin-Lsp1a_1 n=1 Tax=Liphistius sp. SGP-2016 TaxID=1905180 RepID=A0A4V2H979_9ARAC
MLVESFFLSTSITSVIFAEIVAIVEMDVPAPSGFQWINSKNGQVPPKAVNCGYDNGQLLYLGRALHSGDLLPGKVHPAHGCCFVPYNGGEHAVKEYEVLCVTDGGNYEWKGNTNGLVQSNAVQGGVTEEGEPLYVGRKQHDKALVSGKIQPSKLGLFVPFGGNEHFYRDYEVLIGNFNEGDSSEPNGNSRPPCPRPCKPSFPQKRC